MSMSKRRDAGEVGRIDSVSLGLEVFDDGLHVSGVPEGDHVEHEAEGAELFLLPFPVARGELAAATVADAPGETVAIFLPIELNEDAPALLGIVDIVKHMDGLDDASEFGECAGRWRWAFFDLKHAHDRIGLDTTEFEGTGESQEVWPCGDDEFGVGRVDYPADRRRERKEETLEVL